MHSFKSVLRATGCQRHGFANGRKSVALIGKSDSQVRFGTPRLIAPFPLSPFPVPPLSFAAPLSSAVLQAVSRDPSSPSPSPPPTPSSALYSAASASAAPPARAPARNRSPAAAA